MKDHNFSRGKTILFGSIALLCGGIILLVFAEITARIFNEIRGDEGDLKVFAENPHGTGSFRLKPNFYATAVIEGREIEIDINSHGMHWCEVDYEKPEGVTRIAFLGDSFTFGLWASSYKNSFVGIFDSLLANPSFEVLNFGVDGYGFQDMELLIEEEVVRYDPDYVILMAYNGNDFFDTYFGLHRIDVSHGIVEWNKDVVLSKIPAKYVPKRILSQNDGERRRPNIKQFIKDNSALYGRLTQLKDVLRGKNNRPVTRFFDNLHVPEHHFFGDSFWSRTDYPEPALEAIEISQEVLERINHSLESRDVHFAIAAIPHPRQVYVNNPSGPGYDIRNPQEFIKQVANENDIPYLDLLPSIRTYVRTVNPEIFLLNDVHFNDEGHRLIGHVLYDWFVGSIEPGADAVPVDLVAVESN